MIENIFEKLKENKHLIFFIYVGCVVVSWLIGIICDWSSITNNTPSSSAASTIISPLLNGILTFGFLGFGIWTIVTQREHLKKIYFAIFTSYYLIVEYNRGFSGFTSLFYITSHTSGYVIFQDILTIIISLSYLAWVILTILVVFFKKDEYVKILKMIMACIVCLLVIDYLADFIYAIVEQYTWRSTLRIIFSLQSIVLPVIFLTYIPESLPGMCGCHKQEDNSLEQVEEINEN